VFRYLVRGSIVEPLTAQNLAKDRLLKDLLNRGASLLSSSAGESTFSDYFEQRRLSAEARAEYVKALGVEGLGAHPLRQRVESASAAQLHELLAGQRAAPFSPLSVNLLDVFMRSPGLFRFAQLNEEWPKTLSRLSQLPVALDELFREIWNLVLPGAPPPDDTWNGPEPTIRFIYFAQDNNTAAKCVAYKLFPTVDVIETRQVRRLLQMAQSPLSRIELEGVADHISGIRNIGNEWLPLKLIETAAAIIENRKSASEQSKAAVDEFYAQFLDHDAGHRSTDDEPLRTREALIQEIVKNLSEDNRLAAADKLENIDDAGLRELVGRVSARQRQQKWPELAAQVISTLEAWGGTPEFCRRYSPSSAAPAAVAQFAAFNLQNWPKEATGQLANWKRELAGLLRKNLTDDPGGTMKIESLVTYAEVLLYRKIAKGIDETLKSFTLGSSAFPPEIARGVSTIRTLRQAFPYGANAAVIRLNQLLQEMDGNGNTGLAQLAAANRLKVAMPRFSKNPSASASI
jgi:hypothetical protein